MEIDYESLVKNPGSFGLPTFEEYSANPAKYVKLMRGGGDDSVFSDFDDSQQQTVLGRIMKNVKHEICGYKAKSLEEVERIARSQGIDLRALKYRAAIQPLGGGSGEVLVKWMSNEEYSKRSNW